MSSTRDDDDDDSSGSYRDQDDASVETPAKAARTSKSASTPKSAGKKAAGSLTPAADAKLKAALDAKVLKKIVSAGHTGKNKPFTEISQGMTREFFDRHFGELGEASSRTANLHRRICKDADEIAAAFNITLPMSVKFTGKSWVPIGWSGGGGLKTNASFESLALKHESKTNTVTLKFRTFT